MAEVILLDTGPLVALLDKDEEHYGWATSRMRGLTPPLMVCEAALTETCFLLKSHAHALGPFSEERDQAERVFQQEVAELYDRLPPPKPEFQVFRKGVI